MTWRVLFGCAAAVTAAAAGPASGPAGKLPAEDAWRHVVEVQLERYPAMQAEDLYKLAHQATFGPAHLITDEAVARRYLLDELARVTADESEPLVEGLAAEPALVRVNLRAFKARSGDPQVLLGALLATANSVRGEASAMRERLTAATELLQARGRKTDADRLRQLSAELEARGFPATHHSEVYARSYRPAYRVVRRDLFPGV